MSTTKMNPPPVDMPSAESVVKAVLKFQATYKRAPKDLEEFTQFATAASVSTRLLVTARFATTVSGGLLFQLEFRSPSGQTYRVNGASGGAEEEQARRNTEEPGIAFPRLPDKSRDGEKGGENE